MRKRQGRWRTYWSNRERRWRRAICCCSLSEWGCRCGIARLWRRSIVRDDLPARDGRQGTPHGNQIDVVAEEADRAVAQGDIHTAGVTAARRDGVVGAGVAVDAGQVQLRLVIAPADVEQVRAATVRRQLRVDVTVARLIPPGHA